MDTPERSELYIDLTLDDSFSEDQNIAKLCLTGQKKLKQEGADALNIMCFFCCQ